MSRLGLIWECLKTAHHQISRYRGINANADITLAFQKQDSYCKSVAAGCFLENEDDTFSYCLRLFWSNNEADCLATLLLILAFFGSLLWNVDIINNVNNVVLH